MANKSHRAPENVPGRFYVDDSCIDCDLCRSQVPQVFGRSDASQGSYVRRQPETPEDINATQEALASCPTDSIGDDAPSEPSLAGERNALAGCK